MRISLPLPCHTCGIRDPVLVQLDGPWWEWDCPGCGASNALLSSVDWTKGRLILERAAQYRQQADYASSIVFSAMALEAELARLYFKWRRQDAATEWIAHGGPPIDPRPTEAELEREYRYLGRTISKKIGRVGHLLDERGVDEFARHSDLAERIENDVPGLNIGTLATDIQQAVFWPRNRVVHVGYTAYDETEARRAESIVSVTLDLLKQMDRARRR